MQVQQHKSKEDFTDAAPSNMLSFSNSDLFSQIRILPGVSLATANTGYNVAGGGTDENLILLEGIPIYSPIILIRSSLYLTEMLLSRLRSTMDTFLHNTRDDFHR